MKCSDCSKTKERATEFGEGSRLRRMVTGMSVDAIESSVDPPGSQDKGEDSLVWRRVKVETDGNRDVGGCD